MISRDPFYLKPSWGWVSACPASGFEAPSGLWAPLGAPERQSVPCVLLPPEHWHYLSQKAIQGGSSGQQHIPREPAWGSLASAPRAVTCPTDSLLWSGCSVGLLLLLLVPLVWVCFCDNHWSFLASHITITKWEQRNKSLCFGMQKGDSGSLQVIVAMLL